MSSSSMRKVHRKPARWPELWWMEDPSEWTSLRTNSKEEAKEAEEASEEAEEASEEEEEARVAEEASEEEEDSEEEEEEEAEEEEPLSIRVPPGVTSTVSQDLKRHCD